MNARESLFHGVRRSLFPFAADKGYSEETCIRCGWKMGDQPLNCQNDDTPHVFPSTELALMFTYATIEGWEFGD